MSQNRYKLRHKLCNGQNIPLDVWILKIIFFKVSGWTIKVIFFTNLRPYYQNNLFWTFLFVSYSKLQKSKNICKFHHKLCNAKMWWQSDLHGKTNHYIVIPVFIFCVPQPQKYAPSEGWIPIGWCDFILAQENIKYKKSCKTARV